MTKQDNVKYKTTNIQNIYKMRSVFKWQSIGCSAGYNKNNLKIENNFLHVYKYNVHM